MTQEYLDTIAYKTDSTIEGDNGQVYLSRVDNSYITRVGMEDKAILPFLEEHKVTLLEGGKVACIGFSPTEQKWYGWSHRAIYGFGIGSKTEKGNCGYVASTPEELIDDHANFFADISPESAELHRAECQILDDRSGIRILPAPLNIPMANSIEEALDPDAELPIVDIHADTFHEIKCGRGAWTATTLEEAKQMAADFAEGVG